MKVLFVVPRFHTNLFFATKALTNFGYDVHIICTDQGKLEDHSFVKPKIVGASEIHWPYLYSYLEKLNPDVVIIRDVGRLSKILYWQSLLQRRLMIGYDQRPFLKPRHLGRVMHGFLRGRPVYRLTPVHGIAETGSTRPDPRATYLPFPVEAAEIGERIYAPNGVTRILCVAKLGERRKNHMLLLKALEQLAARHRFTISFAGSAALSIKGGDDAYLQDLLAYAENGPLSDRMTIRQNVPFAGMDQLYAEHDICVLPSRKEPLGTAPLEAMARGCAAIIASDAGSAYYVQGAEPAGMPCGSLFRTGDEEDLRAVIERFLASPEAVEKMGCNALQWARQEFSLELFAARFTKLVKHRQGQSWIARRML